MIEIDRRRLLLAGASLTAASALPAAAHATTTKKEPVSRPAHLPLARQPVVEVSSGRLRGIESGGVRIFKGVPYAASTAGQNRFQPPQAVSAWSGVRDALAYGPQCPVQPASAQDQAYVQNPEDAFLLYRGYTPHTQHEDCLRLNVWAPTGGKRLPVMVYMHGGAFVAGSGNDLLAYEGENLARRGDVIVITHNHRLNLFGYLDLSHLGDEWSNSVNLGMQDIVAVLRWVRENIGAFGGDPENVTIFGQSGGGGKVQTLMAMPSAQGLFHKAIVQSGTIPGFGLTSTDQAQQMTSAVLGELDITKNKLSRLSELSVDQLCQAALANGRAFFWSPVLDGKIVSTAPGVDPKALAPGIPLMVGTVLNELENPVDDPRATDFDEAALLAEAKKVHGSSAQDIVAAYQASYPQRAPIEIWYAMKTAGIRTASLELSDRKHKVDGKTWQYMFNWATPMLEGRPKTFHSAEIAFVFNNAELCANQTGGGPEALQLAGQMSDAWIAFARNGDPNHGGLPHWPSFSAKRETMLFDTSCRVELDPEKKGRELIAQATQTQ